MLSLQIMTDEIVLDIFIQFLEDLVWFYEGLLSEEEHHQFEITPLMKMAVFWDVALCCLAKIDRRFGVAYCLHNQGATFQKTAIFILVVKT
jgi:hypothetical protein